MHPLLVTGEATIAEAGWLLLVAAVVVVVVVVVVELLKIESPHLHRILCGRVALLNRLLLLALHACCEHHEAELPLWWWLFSIPLSKQRKQNGET